jgi:hypothetical protein
MCEIDTVLRLAEFIYHWLPEFLSLLALEGKNKKLNCPFTDQLHLMLYSNIWSRVESH